MVKALSGVLWGRLGIDGENRSGGMGCETGHVSERMGMC